MRDVTVTLIEIDPELVGIAAENIARNGLDARARAVMLDVLGPSDAFTAAGLRPGSADHVLTNPPFNDPARLKPSPDRGRSSAHASVAGALVDWLSAAAWLLAWLLWSVRALPLIWRRG